jgi:hypothetical protein
VQIKKICDKGLLRVGHPLNPSKAVDEGFFGIPTHGIYVSRYADYIFKYSSQLEALNAGETCKVVMFHVLPGHSLHIEKQTAGLKPAEGYDSHSSSNFQEWCVVLCWCLGCHLLVLIVVCLLAGTCLTSLSACPCTC